MDKHKRDILKAGGWKSGTVAEFLQLTPEESELVELRLKLSSALRSRRLTSGHTQRQVAVQIHSSQSRLAKMEAADSSVSIDLLVRGLLHLGWNVWDIANALMVGGLVQHSKQASLGSTRIPGTFSFSRSAGNLETIEVKDFFLA